MIIEYGFNRVKIMPLYLTASFLSQPFYCPSYIRIFKYKKNLILIIHTQQSHQESQRNLHSTDFPSSREFQSFDYTDCPASSDSGYDVGRNAKELVCVFLNKIEKVTLRGWVAPSQACQLSSTLV